ISPAPAYPGVVAPRWSWAEVARERRAGARGDAIGIRHDRTYLEGRRPDRSGPADAGTAGAHQSTSSRRRRTDARPAGAVRAGSATEAQPQPIVERETRGRRLLAGRWCALRTVHGDPRCAVHLLYQAGLIPRQDNQVVTAVGGRRGTSYPRQINLPDESHAGEPHVDRGIAWRHRGDRHSGDIRWKARLRATHLPGWTFAVQWV